MRVRAMHDRIGGAVLRQVRSVILLGGAIRKNDFLAAAGRSALDLPVEQGGTLFDHWQENCSRLADLLDRKRIPLRLVLDAGSPRPELLRVHPSVNVHIERDPRPLRGTGGLIRDLAEEYDPDDFLLVANAAQVLIDPLDSLVESMAGTGSEMCVVSHLDGTPSGLMLVRCECLQQIPPVGYIDMKEQGLPKISDRHRTSVVYRDGPSGMPVRTSYDYIRALGRFHRSRRRADFELDPFAEDWESAFHIVEDGAEVEPGARLHDSVVLGGGCVQRGALVARSIVCPHGVVPGSRRVVDRLITY